MRRAAAAGLGAWVLGNAAFSCHAPRTITGGLFGPDLKSGHRLRPDIGLGKVAAAPAREVQTQLVIVGGGVAGLACAWQLRQSGFHDFVLLEMEAACGGNARGGSQNGMRHPWGAHYLPVPDARNAPLMQFLKQIEVVLGLDRDQRPIFNELYLCHSPQERLQIHGVWQHGLVPHTGVPADELAQIHRFFEAIETWKNTRGVDGKLAFSIPAETSSQDPAFLKLDQLTFAAYLKQEGYDSTYLNWYLDYCSRDDYGLPMAECSAWAGLHYFAARAGGGANAESGAVLTWPEGNGWLTNHLRKDLIADGKVLHRHMASAVANTANGVEVIAQNLEQPGQQVRVQARAAVFAGPQYVARHVVRDFDRKLEGFDYAPWLVANMRVNLQGHSLLKGMNWDNVAYDRASLGYVFAGHQSLAGHLPAEGVLTWYEPVTHMPPAEARKWLLAADYETLRDRVLADMEFMHPGISAHIEQLDVWRWGHGMVRPVPGLMTGKAIAEARMPLGRIHFAHSDLSGISIFEEAFHRGVVAADAVLAAVGGEVG